MGFPFKQIDLLSEWLGLAAAWIYFGTGIIIVYEVTARYVFNAPTIWVQEVSQLFLLWATFLAISRALKHNQHIRISAFDHMIGDTAKKWMRLFSLVFIASLCLLAVFYGTQIFWDSFERGRSTGTILNIPNWWSEIIIPLGFGLMFLQAVTEMVRLFSTRESQ